MTTLLQFLGIEVTSVIIGAVMAFVGTILAVYILRVVLNFIRRYWQVLLVAAVFLGALGFWL